MKQTILQTKESADWSKAKILEHERVCAERFAGLMKTLDRVVAVMGIGLITLVTGLGTTIVMLINLLAGK